MSTSDLSALQIEDYQRFYVKDPKGFSPAHNKAVIDETIRKTNEMRIKKQKEYHEQVRIRTDAVATFLNSVSQGKSNDIDKYFGRKLMSELRGQKILSILKNTKEGRMRELIETSSTY